MHYIIVKLLVQLLGFYYTVYTVYCILYSVHRTMCSVQYTVYSVYYAPCEKFTLKLNNEKREWINNMWYALSLT